MVKGRLPLYLALAERRLAVDAFARNLFFKEADTVKIFSIICGACSIAGLIITIVFYIIEK